MANVYFIHLYFKETVELFTVYSHITYTKEYGMEKNSVNKFYSGKLQLSFTVT